MILLTFKKLGPGRNVDFAVFGAVLARRIHKFKKDFGGRGRVINGAVVIFKAHAQTSAHGVKRMFTLVWIKLARDAKSIDSLVVELKAKLGRVISDKSAVE